MADNTNDSTTTSSETDESQKSDSCRIQTLNNALTVARRKIVSSAKLSLFQKHLRPIHKKDPEILKKLHAQLIKQLDSHIHEEILLLCAEEEMEKLLNDLDRIVDSQKHNTDKAWRPTDNMEEESQVYKIPAKEKQKAQLQHIVSMLEQQNSLLKEHVTMHQKKLLGTKRLVDNGIDKWRQINDAAKTIPTSEFDQFVKGCGR